MGRNLTVAVVLAIILAACAGSELEVPSTARAAAADETTVSASAEDDAVTVGETVTMGGFDVRVVGARGDDSANGVAYDVKVVVDAFSAVAETTFTAQIDIMARGSSGTEYPPEFADCADGLPVDDVVYPDQTIEGFVCFTVEAGDASGLRLVLSPQRGPQVAMQTTPPVTPSADEFGPDQAVAALIEAGVDARLVVSPYGRDPFLSRAATMHVLCLDAEEALLFEYADETLRRADSDTVLADGTFLTGHADLYFGRVMFWAKGRVIVNYSMGEPPYWDALTAALGQTLTPDSPQRGERPPDFPGSELCRISTGP